MTQCPQCGSAKIWRDGLRNLADGSIVQRWLCRECGYRFTDPNFTKKSLWKNPPFRLNLQNCLDHNCQGNNDPLGREPAATMAANTLVKVEKGEEKSGQAGATAQTADVKGKLVEFIWWMKRQGYRESTIVSRNKRLRLLVNLGADLYNPESVKGIVARQKWKESYKEAVVCAYDLFAKWMGLRWDKPIYKRVQRLPFIPLEREIDDLISGCSKNISTFLQAAKETGARAGEIFALKWEDVDFENRSINITPEKGSEPRVFRVSQKLLGMLNNLPKTSDNIFGCYKDLDNLMRTFQRQRKRIAHKLANPRLLRISFHTLRHWKATMEYAKTKDIIHVMRVLGHRNIKNTLIYTHLVEGLREDEFTCKIAHTPDEVVQLIEAGFEYVCELEGFKFFRKRK